MFMETREYQTIDKNCPHISNKIMLMWGSQEMNNYFSDLILNTRNGVRKGFDVNISESLRFLFEKHKEEFPKLINVKLGGYYEKSKTRNKSK